MSASDKVALTVTYTATAGATTVTVLGQVLNDGATNWVPSSSNAIYLLTTSGSGDSKTVLDGSTYYLTTGPALPDQATGVTITPSSSATATKKSGTAAATSGSSSAASGGSTGSSGRTSSSPSKTASSSTASASASATKKSGAGASFNPVRGMVWAVLVAGVVGGLVL